MSDTSDSTKIASPELPTNKRVGREIAFGIQQTIACWATDFIDPVVGKWFQNKHGHKDHHVTNKHTWGGEIAGDSAAFFIYMFVKRVFTKPVDMFTAGVKSALDPIYTKLGKKSLEGWRQEAHLDKDDPKYLKRLERYKEFQAENLVDSSIIAASSTAMNVVVQKKLGNKQAIPIILGGKLIGASATVATMLGLRTAVPDAMHTLDHELSDRYFSKVARATGKLFGVKPEDVTLKDPLAADKEIPSKAPLLSNAPLVVGKVDDRKRGQFLKLMHYAYAGRNPESLQDWQQFISEQKSICNAFVEVLNPKGAFAKALSRAHHHALRDLQQQASGNIPASLLKQTAYTSMNSILLNRRDDMASFRLLLDDNAFLSDLGRQVKIPAGERVRAAALPKDKQEELIESLVQTRGLVGREPAVHIYANAKGQIIEHEALAVAFDPEGAAARVLTQELQKRLPAMDATSVERIAKDYLMDRQHAAQLVVDALMLDGPLLEESINRSEALRQASASKTSHVEKLEQPQVVSNLNRY